MDDNLIPKFKGINKIPNWKQQDFIKIPRQTIHDVSEVMFKINKKHSKRSITREKIKNQRSKVITRNFPKVLSFNLWFCPPAEATSDVAEAWAEAGVLKFEF